MEALIKKADVLIEALPYIRRFRNRFMVVKYGGSAIENDQIRLGVLQDLVFMSSVGMLPVLVHGGGPRISQRMREEGVEPKFIKGSRVTDEATIRIVNGVLLELNAQLVREIRKLGGKATGFCGKTGNLIRVRRSREHPELGFVGEITSINRNAVVSAARKGAIPVISSLGVGRDGKIYNVNADYVAARTAAVIRAEKLAILTNVRGIMRDEKEPDTVISTLSPRQAEELLGSGIIAGGMIPKVKAAVAALKGGVKKAHIVDARISHSLLLEIFTDRGIGTEIEVKGKK